MINIKKFVKNVVSKTTGFLDNDQRIKLTKVIEKLDEKVNALKGIDIEFRKSENVYAKF